MATTEATEFKPNTVDPLANARALFMSETAGATEAVPNDQLDDSSTVSESITETTDPSESVLTSKTTITSPPESTTSSTDMETVWVRDAKGKRQKLDISYSDKQKIREAFLKSAGMRKFQMERDNATKTSAELQKKYDELSTDFGKLERLFKERGARGIFEQLGGTGAFDKAIEDELKQREQLASMSPSDRMKLALEEKEKSFQSEKSELQRKYDDMLNKINVEQEKSATKSLEAKLTPAFEKYRFSGKLGDSVAEHKLDRAVWRDATEMLAEYPDNVEITQSLIDKAFRTAAADYERVSKKQAETKLQQAVTKQKDSAAQKAQVTVKKALTANTAEQEIAEDIKNNRWSSVLQKAFNGKLKL